MKRVAVILILFLGLWAFESLNQQPSPKIKTISRVVALAPSFCDTMERLELTHLLVGVSSDCEGAPFERIAKVGRFAEPNFEAIMALKPDLILAVPHPMAKNVIDMASNQSILVQTFQPDSLEDIFLATISLAKTLNAQKKGEEVVAQMKEALKVRQKGEKTFLIALSPSPLVVAGKNTFASKILENWGFKNLADGEISWPIWPLEELIKHPPDIFLLTDQELLPLYQNLFDNLHMKQKMLIPDRPLFTSPSPKLIEDITYLKSFLLETES